MRTTRPQKLNSSTPMFDGAKIARKRAALGMTQEELASAAGLSRHTIMRMEKSRGASFEGLASVCRTLEMPVADVFTADPELVPA